jgi:predicted dehydrogenase
LPNRLKAGIIGLGVGERHISGYETDPRCEVTALCDIDKNKLHEVSKRNPGRRLCTDQNDILEDPTIDVVSIASYDDAHRDQVIKAIENGKHIFVEKPLCLNQQEFEDISQALKAHENICLSSNLILRRTPRFIELRKRITQGKLGDIFYLEGDYDYGRLHKLTVGWRGKIPFYSVVHGGAIHLIDLMLWLTQSCVQEVFALGTRMVTKGTAFRHYDLVSALLKFESGSSDTDGMLAKITANFGCVVPHHHKLSVYGTEGTFNQGHTDTTYFHSREPSADVEKVIDPYPGASKGDMLPSFVKSLLDGTPAEISKKEVLDTMAVALAIEKSLKTKKMERVNYA